MNTTKRAIALILSILLLFSLSACQILTDPIINESNESIGVGNDETKVPTNPYETEKNASSETMSDSDSESNAESESNITIPPTDSVDKPDKIKNIIIIIGDGMGPEHIEAGQLASGNKFSFANWKKISVDTSSVDTSGNGPILTDSAAGATAIASGYLNNGYRIC